MKVRDIVIPPTSSYPRKILPFPWLQAREQLGVGDYTLLNKKVPEHGFVYNGGVLIIAFSTGNFEFIIGSGRFPYWYPSFYPNLLYCI